MTRLELDDEMVKAHRRVKTKPVRGCHGYGVFYAGLASECFEADRISSENVDTYSVFIHLRSPNVFRLKGETPHPLSSGMRKSVGNRCADYGY